MKQGGVVEAVQEKLRDADGRRGIRETLAGALRVDRLKESPWTQILHSPLRYALGMSAVAFGEGFARYFNHTVLFPAFPNVLDSVGMVSIGAFLLIDVVRDVKRRTEVKNEAMLLLRRAAKHPQQSKLDPFVRGGRDKGD